MSDSGLLSYEYNELATLARQLKDWTIALKQVFYKIPQSTEEEAVQADLDTALRGLKRTVEFLCDVIEVEDEGAWPEHWLTSLPLPTLVVERLRKAHTFEGPLYVSRLERLRDRLQVGISSLTRKDIELIDDIVLATNADANAIFRRLMRWG